jgi:N-methylhydantoinase A
MLARDTLASGLKLDVDAALAALARLGEQLGLESEQAARGVLRVAGATMAGAIRAVSIEVGEDPRSAALIAYGGAGPLFASLLARELGIRTIVIPNYAGNFSAWGLLEQDVVRSAALTIVSPLDDEGIARAQRTIELLIEQLDSRAEADLQGTVTHEAEFDLRYPGQEYTLTVPVALADGRIAEPPQEIARRFADLYERTYGHSFDVGVDILSVRAIERTVLPRAARPRHSISTGAGHAPRTAHRAYSFANEEWCDFELIERESLAPGARFAGPAIVMEATTTSYIDAGLSGTVHDSGALILTDAVG